jgi:hypothetical protein
MSAKPFDLWGSVTRLAQEKPEYRQLIVPTLRKLAGDLSAMAAAAEKLSLKARATGLAADHARAAAAHHVVATQAMDRNLKVYHHRQASAHDKAITTSVTLWAPTYRPAPQAVYTAFSKLATEHPELRAAMVPLLRQALSEGQKEARGPEGREEGRAQEGRTQVRQRR